MYKELPCEFIIQDDYMKKVVQAFYCGAGRSLIVFGAKAQNTVIGCLLFTIGVIVLVGAMVSICKEAQKDKKEK